MKHVVENDIVEHQLGYTLHTLETTHVRSLAASLRDETMNIHRSTVPLTTLARVHFDRRLAKTTAPNAR